ncbi:hypothetical protein [Paenibacillus macerans]|nr:hypothetical protein [Paenibacillus macerans]
MTRTLWAALSHRLRFATLLETATVQKVDALTSVKADLGGS